MDDEGLLAMVTCPDAETATRIGRTLVEDRLAACVDQIPEVTSTYSWEGRLQSDTEVLLLAKTTQGALADLMLRVHGVHPYELPEIVALPLCGGSQRYPGWVRQSVGPV